jgi:hypothetical protein
MEFVSFLKILFKKGKIYYDVWLPILFQLEENGLGNTRLAFR